MLNTGTETHMLGKLRQAGAAPLWARGLAALLAALVLAAASPPAASAAEDFEMRPNSVLGDVEAYDGPPLQEPDDGRIRGYGLAASVAKAGPTNRVKRLFTWDAPGEGQRLVGFKLRLDQTPPGVDHRIHGAVIADGGRIPIPDSELTVKEGEYGFVASVPAAAKEIVLELSVAGYAQSFSLTSLARTGPQPTVLYRDPLSPDVVKENMGERTLRVAEVGTGAKGLLTIRLEQARLTFFTPPDPVGPAADASLAFLVIKANAFSPDSGDSQFAHHRALPASAVTATLPGGTVVPARHSGPEDEGYMSGYYYFPVPGDTEAARVTIRPGTFDAYRHGEDGAEPRPVKSDGAAGFDVEFTPGGASRLPDLAKDDRAGAASPTTVAEGGAPDDRPAGEREGGGAALPALILVLLLGGGAAGALYLRRRTLDRQPPDGDKPTSPEPGPLEAAPLPSPLATLAGAGAVDAARAALTAALETGRAEVVVLDTGAASSVADDLLDWPVRYVEDEADLVREVEAAHLTAARAAASAADEGTNGGRHHVLALAPGPVGQPVAELPRRFASTAVGVRLLVLGGDLAPVVTVEPDGSAALDDGRRCRVPVAPPSPPDDAEPEPEPAAEPAPVETSAAPPPAQGHAPDVAVDLLGPYRISVGDEVVGSGLRKKAREMLALLAVEPQGVTLDAAVESLFGPAGRRKSADVRQAVTNLRAVLRSGGQPVVARVGTRYVLDRSLVALDVADFERAAEAGDDDAAARAAALYRGELATGEDYPWIEPERERLRGVAADVLARAARRCRSSGDLDGAAAALDRALSIERYSEPLFCELMAVYREQRREDAVRRTYARLEAALAEIREKPDPRTRALYASAAPLP